MSRTDRKEKSMLLNVHLYNNESIREMNGMFVEFLARIKRLLPLNSLSFLFTMKIQNDPVPRLSSLYSIYRPRVQRIARRSRQYFAAIRAAVGSVLFNIKELTAPRAGQCVSLSQLSTWTSTPIDTPKDSRIVPLGREMPFPSSGYPVELIP